MATNPITFSGFNGYDFGSIINAIMQQESAHLTDLQTQQQNVQQKDTALTTLGSKIASLETDAKNLSDATAFLNVSATSSDPTILTASSGSDAIAGHYDVVIDHTAKAQVTTSTTSQSSTSAVVADGGAISFTINGQTTTAISVTSSTTLAQLKDLINQQNSGVVASLVNTGSAYKLVLSSRTTGAANGFVVNNSLTNSGGTSVAFALRQNTTTDNTQNAQDAALTVNGLAITSASNTISGAIPGISFNIIKAGTVALDVAANYDNLKHSLQTLVTDYNQIRSFYAAQKTPDSTGHAGPLGNDSGLREVFSDIRIALQSSSSNAGGYSFLSQVGVEITRNGDLQFTESTFVNAMSGHGTDVAKLFQGSSANGIFNSFEKQLEKLDSTSGLIKTTKDSIHNTVDRFRQQINDEQARLDKRRKDLELMYSAADQTISQLTQEGNSLSSMAGRF
jgi:flagellar hook-associated protein 2